MVDINSYLPTLMQKLQTMPIHEVMRDDERQRGNTVVIPGEVDWLSADDWDATVTVSIAGKEVRIIAILAKKPGSGAFRRLIAGIVSAGLNPVVIEPFHHMTAILTIWGWRRRHLELGFNSEEQWRPRKAVEL